jgi:DNA polymerase-3 subunit epsilon
VSKVELHPYSGTARKQKEAIKDLRKATRDLTDRLTFVAIDLETADHGPDSACAVGLARVCGGNIVYRKHYLIKPTRNSFFFTHIHGITWEKVQKQPTFEELWPRIGKVLSGANFIASHNVGFDRRVLESCCQVAKIPRPEIRYVCTVKLARRLWDIRPTSLSNVCRYLGLRLDPHEVLSDAEACVGIVLAARQAGAEI